MPSDTPRSPFYAWLDHESIRNFVQAAIAQAQRHDEALSHQLP